MLTNTFLILFCPLLVAEVIRLMIVKENSDFYLHCNNNGSAMYWKKNYSGLNGDRFHFFSPHLVQPNGTLFVATATHMYSGCYVCTDAADQSKVLNKVEVVVYAADIYDCRGVHLLDVIYSGSNNLTGEIRVGTELLQCYTTKEDIKKTRMFCFLGTMPDNICSVTLTTGATFDLDLPTRAVKVVNALDCATSEDMRGKVTMGVAITTLTFTLVVLAALIAVFFKLRELAGRDSFSDCKYISTKVVNPYQEVVH